MGKGRERGGTFFPVVGQKRECEGARKFSWKNCGKDWGIARWGVEKKEVGQVWG